MQKKKKKKRKDSDAHTHAITNARAHSTACKNTELINFLTHLQKFISKTERICSCKCDEKPLSAEISEASGEIFLTRSPFCHFRFRVHFLFNSFYSFASVFTQTSHLLLLEVALKSTSLMSAD